MSTTQLATAHVEEAKAHNEAIRTAAATIDRMDLASNSYKGKGNGNVIFKVAKDEVEMSFEANGCSLSFSGKGAGAGFGTGTTEGSVTFFVDPCSLSGESRYTLNASKAGKQCTINFTVDGAIVATYSGNYEISSGHRGGGAGTGKGTWS